MIKFKHNAIVIYNFVKDSNSSVYLIKLLQNISKEKFNENDKEYIRKTNLFGISFIRHKGELHYEEGLAISTNNFLSSIDKKSWDQYWYDGVKFQVDNLKEFKEAVYKYKLQQSIQNF